MESRAPPQALPMGLRRVSKVCYPHHPGPALYARVFFIAWSCVKRAPEHIGPLHLARAQMAELGSGGFIQL